jgi:hypothetical protein
LEPGSKVGKQKYEFQHLTPNDISRIREEINAFQLISGLKLTGGKFPGNKENEFSERIIEDLGFHWWTKRLLFNVKNLKELEISRIGSKKNIICIPQTFIGDGFKYYPPKENNYKNPIKHVRAKFRLLKNEKHLLYLYENNIPITIQEHFQNATTRGRRQRPNIFDDIDSIENIYSLLRGSDVWYIGCNKFAQYSDCYFNTQVITEEDLLTIKYKGSRDNYLLSFISDVSQFINNKTGQKIHGVYKNGKWIFNSLYPGEYRLNEI